VNVLHPPGCMCSEFILLNYKELIAKKSGKEVILLKVLE
jgi:hypothetical protein